ncbi:hypothetical protein WJ978_00530 [Achromobacter xylosoxidans]
MVATAHAGRMQAAGDTLRAILQRGPGVAFAGRDEASAAARSAT